MTKDSACLVAVFYCGCDEQGIVCHLNRNQQLVVTWHMARTVNRLLAALMQICFQKRSANDFIHCGETNGRAVHYVTRDVVCTDD